MTYNIDVTKIDDNKLVEMIYLGTQISKTNYGEIFSKPATREFFGQSPLEIKTVELPVDSQKRPDLNGLRQLVESTAEPLLIVNRDDTCQLLCTFYVPGAIKKSTPHIKDFDKEISKYIVAQLHRILTNSELG